MTKQINLNSKLPNFGTTVFTVMSQLAQEYSSINLGQGFPDFNPDEKILNYLSDAVNEGHNQYPPMPGIFDLRDKISKKIKDLYNFDYCPNNEVTVTAGATQALLTAIMTVVQKDDEVVIIEPFYDSYVPAILLCDAKPVPVSMTVPNENNPYYSIDWNKVDQAITEKTRLLILNSPHNPTGYTFTKSDLDAINQIMLRHQHIFILSDEVYEHIIFDTPHLSLSMYPTIAERAMVVSSFGKTFHVTGWKVGYCVAPEYLMKEFRKIHQFNVFTVNTPAQYAIANYLNHKDAYLNLGHFYKNKKQILENALKNSRFKPIQSTGTYFMLANYENISDLNEQDFSIYLTKTHGITVIPVSAFYLEPSSKQANNHLVRFCFAKKDTTLDLASSKILSI